MKTHFISNLYRYFPDGMINFFLSTGLLLGLLDAFEVSFHLLPLLLGFFVFSMLFTILCHQKTLHRILFYLLFFLFYFFGVTRYSIYLNSGFYTILNTIIDEYGFYLNTKNYQAYQILATDIRLAVTLFVLFFGSFYLLLLNAAAAEKKSLFVTMFFSILPLALPLYIHKEPGIFYETCIFSGYALLFWRKQKKKVYPVGKRDFFLCQLTIALLFVCLLIPVTLFHLCYPSEKHTKNLVENKLKTEHQQYVSYFIMFGLSGFFNDYTATGGINGGYLGGINAIRPDYETDLIVEFVPYANETLYLKAYTGFYYQGNRWLDATESIKKTASNLSLYEAQEYNTLKNTYQATSSGAKALLRLKNIGASRDYFYRPYYSMYSGMLNTELPDIARDDDGFYELHFYPLLDELSFTGGTNTEMDPTLDLQVPDSLKELLDNICEERDFSGSTEEILEKIKSYFAEDFTYTMSPGKTPKKADFVSYFLTESKKGYCTHFASAAVMLLRNAGIPARYVEGYALAPYDMETGIIQEQLSVKEFYDGAGLPENASVLRCEINDSQAHSWVEYYDADFGWRVFDGTPSSTEDSEIDFSNFWNRISRMMPAMSFQTETTNSDTAQTPSLSLSPSFFRTALLLSMCILLFLFWLRYFSHSRETNVQRQYQSLCQKIRKKYPDFSGCQSHEEQVAFLSHILVPPKQCLQSFLLLERIAYARTVHLTREEYHMLIKTFFLLYIRLPKIKKKLSH